MTHKIIIGLTGNIATGKSTVMALAAERGADTIDADKVAHQILRSTLVKHDIELLFGAAVFAADGEIDRPALGKIVFSDPEKLRDLEGIIHPAVRHEIGRQITESTADVVMVEAIKLLEGPLKEHCQQIWVTACSAETQLARLIIYRNADPEDARQRIAAQSSQAAKIEQADILINSDNDMETTILQFETAWEQLGLEAAT